jgi:pyruvate-formate lyase-activating enzyme
MSEAPPPKTITTARGYTRTVTARLIAWRCEWCSNEEEEYRYPGPTPRYCSDKCRHEAQNSLAAGDMRRRRAARPPSRRGPGRPRTL